VFSGATAIMRMCGNIGITETGMNIQVVGIAGDIRVTETMT
jgi:hypothetical protein